MPALARLLLVVLFLVTQKEHKVSSPWGLENIMLQDAPGNFTCECDSYLVLLVLNVHLCDWLCLNAFDAKFGTALHCLDQFQSFVVVHGIRYMYESLEDKDLSVFYIFLFNLLVLVFSERSCGSELAYRLDARYVWYCLHMYETHRIKLNFHELKAELIWLWHFVVAQEN